MSSENDESTRRLTWFYKQKNTNTENVPLVGVTANEEFPINGELEGCYCTMNT